MRVAIELKNKIIVGYAYRVDENYESFDGMEIIDVESEQDIVPYKTKWENGELVHLDDFAAEYYALQEAEEQQRAIAEQLAELYAWFEEYDNQIKQYERDVRLGQIGTYHIGDVVYTINELDITANTKAAQITALRGERQ